MEDLRKHLTKLIESGWTQSEIAREAGTHQPVINRIIRLKQIDCTYEIGRRIAKLRPKQCKQSS